MLFLAQPRGEPGGDASLPSYRRLARVLLACCAMAALATAFPWTAIDAPHLFGFLDGPVGANTTSGFSCLVTCTLTGLLLLGEGRNDTTREPVRAACMVLMATAAAMLGLHFASGPRPFRGVATEFSPWFFAAALGALLGAIAAKRRLRKRASA